MKARLVVFLTVAVICGCTSFDVFIELPDVRETASVALYANAVQGVHELESGEAIRLPGGIWRVKLKKDSTCIRLPFVPNELLLSVNAEGHEGVFHIEGVEDGQGNLNYKVKSMSGGTKSWAIKVTAKDQSTMVITINMGKEK